MCARICAGTRKQASQPDKYGDRKPRAADAAGKPANEQRVVGESGTAGGLLRGNLGAFHAAEESARSGRRAVCNGRGGGGWRRPFAKDVHGTRFTRNVYERLVGT